MSIAEIREKHPEYNDLTDIDLSVRLHQKFYKDIPYQDFIGRIGFTPPRPEPAPEPGFLDKTKDLAVGAGRKILDFGGRSPETPQQQIVEGLGKTGAEFAKFLPALAAGTTELLPGAEGEVGLQQAEGFQQPEKRTFSKKLVAAGKRFEQVMGIGRTPASTEGAAMIMDAIAMPFEALENLALPQIKKVMIASGFEGDARDLDEGARFIYSAALVAGTAGVAKGVGAVKGAAKGRTPQIRGEIPAKAPVAAPKVPAAAKAPAKAPTTPQRLAKADEAISELRAHKKKKKRVKLAKKAEKIEAIKAGPVPNKPHLEFLDDVFSQPVSKGGKVFLEAERQGGTPEVFGFGSDSITAPWTKGKDFTKAEARLVIKKALEGKQLNSHQQLVLDDIISASKKDFDIVSKGGFELKKGERPRVLKRKPTQPDFIGAKEGLKGKVPAEEAPIEPGSIFDLKGRERLRARLEAAKKQRKIDDFLGDVEPATPARKTLEVAKQNKELPGFIEETLGSETGALNLERLAGEISGRSKVARELVSQRGKDINIMKLESAKFIRDLKFGGKKLSETPGIRARIEAKLAEKGQRDKFTVPEREAITLLAQKIKDPEVLRRIGREKVIDIINKPTPEILSAVAKVRKYFDEGFKFIQENPGGEGLPYLENYVTQIWDIPKNKRVVAHGGFRVDNPFTKKRKIPSIQEGIEQGFTPKTLDITEILQIYDKYRIETHANRKLVDALGELKVFDETTGKMEPLVKRADKAPDDWVVIDHPALNLSKFVGKLPEEGGIILSKTPLKVHPEIAPWLKNIFGKPLGAGLPKPVQQGIAGATVINAFAKKGQLSLSLFHGNALMESMASSGQLLRSWGMLNPLKAYRAIRFENFEIFKNMEITKDSIRNGDVQYGALSDVQKGIVDNALKEMETRTRKIPGISHLTRGIRSGNRLWDAGLWDYIQNTFKLFAYEGQVAGDVAVAAKKVAKGKRKPLTPEEILNIKGDTGKFVNDSFGGQNWDLKPVLGHPSIRQLAQLTFLSPDWTVSTLRQAGALPKGFAKAIGTGNKTQLKRAGFFWMRSVLYFNIIAQAVNYQNTKKEYGEGRFTNKNAPGKHLDIFIGRNPDGTERYLRTGKQFREVMEWGEDPLGKAGAKMSPILREGIRQLSKHDPGSGFPTEFAKDAIWSPESLKKRGISLISLPIPFSLRSFVSDRPANFMFTWPTSKGMSNFKTRRLFEEAIRKKRLDDIQRIYISALENGLDADALFSQTRAKLKSDITYDNRKVARKIDTELKQMETEEQKEALIDSYKKRKILNAAVIIEFDKLQKRGEKVKKKQKVIKLIRKKKEK